MSWVLHPFYGISFGFIDCWQLAVKHKRQQRKVFLVLENLLFWEIDNVLWGYWWPFSTLSYNTSTSPWHNKYLEILYFEIYRPKLRSNRRQYLFKKMCFQWHPDSSGCAGDHNVTSKTKQNKLRVLNNRCDFGQSFQFPLTNDKNYIFYWFQSLTLFNSL